MHSLPCAAQRFMVQAQPAGSSLGELEDPGACMQHRTRARACATPLHEAAWCRHPAACLPGCKPRVCARTHQTLPFTAGPLCQLRLRSCHPPHKLLPCNTPVAGGIGQRKCRRHPPIDPLRDSPTPAFPPTCFRRLTTSSGNVMVEVHRPARHAHAALRTALGSGACSAPAELPAAAPAGLSLACAAAEEAAADAARCLKLS